MAGRGRRHDRDPAASGLTHASAGPVLVGRPLSSVRRRWLSALSERAGLDLVGYAGIAWAPVSVSLRVVRWRRIGVTSGPG